VCVCVRVKRCGLRVPTGLFDRARAKSLLVAHFALPKS